MLSVEKIDTYKLSLLDKCAGVIFGAIASIFYVRYLGVELKGTYSYINQIIQIVTLIANFGIYQSYPYYYAEKKDEIYEQYLSLFLVQLVIYLILAFIVSKCVNSYVVVLVCLEAPFAIFKLQYDNVMMIQKINAYYVANIALSIAKAVIYFIFWRACPSSLFYMVMSVVITDILVCVAYFISCPIKLSRRSISMSFLKETLGFGFLPMISSLLLTLNYSLDIIMLKTLGNPIELGLYSLAETIIGYVWLVPNAFKEVLASRLVREDGKNRLVELSIKASLIATAAALVIYIPTGKFLLTIMFGEDFAGTYLPLLILFIGAFSMIYFKMLGTVLMIEGRRVSYCLFLLLSVLTNFIANLLLIPKFGMYGASWASVGSYTVCGLAFLIYYCKLRNITASSLLVVNREDVNYFLHYIKKDVQH